MTCIRCPNFNMAAVQFICAAVRMVCGTGVAGVLRLHYPRWVLCPSLALFAYIGAGLLAHPNVGEVLRASLIPHVELTAGFATTLVAILGTTISPYVLFWQRAKRWRKKSSSDGIACGGEKARLTRS